MAHYVVWQALFTGSDETRPENGGSPEITVTHMLPTLTITDPVYEVVCMMRYCELESSFALKFSYHSPYYRFGGAQPFLHPLNKANVDVKCGS